MKGVIQSSTKTVKDLFDVDCWFNIPDYQRDYVWGKGQIEDLWDDLFDNYQTQDRPPYLLGSMVMLESSSRVHSSPGGFFEDVIDGQQRITTLMIMASVLVSELRKYIHSPNNSDTTRLSNLASICAKESTLAKHSSFNERSTISFDFDDKNELSCFFKGILYDNTSRKDKNEFYSGWINTPKSGLTTKMAEKLHQALYISYSKLLKRLKSERFNERESFLKEFSRMFLTGVFVLKIQPASESVAYNIFESLNNRGYALAPEDLIKNHLFKKAIDKDKVQNKWVKLKELSDDLPLGTSLIEVIHFSYLSRFGFCQKNKLYEKVSKLSVSSEEYIDGLLSDVESISLLQNDKHAKHLSNIKGEREIAIEETADFIKYMKIKFMFVLIVAIFSDSASKNQWDKWIHLINNFVFRYMKIIPDTSLNAMAKELSKLATEVRLGSAGLKEAKQVFRSLANDNEFVKHLASKSFSPKAKSLLGYTLSKIYNQVSVGVITGKIGTRKNDNHLEHIMPQSPGPKEWPRASHLKDENRAKFDDYLWRLGNITILESSINTKIGNSSFVDKTKEYSKSKIQHNVRISKKSLSEWGVDEILVRQKALARYSLKVWAI